MLATMDEINRKFRAIDWAKLQRQARKVQASTASALKDLVMTDLENKVRAATADTTWGASGSDLMEMAQGTYNREDYALIMSIVWQRLGSSRWRCVYKSLDVLKFLLMHGSSRCLEEARAAQHHIQSLEHFRCIDPDTHKDEGENVRARAALVVAMIMDPAMLEEEREKSKALRAKIGVRAGMTGLGGTSGGISSDDYRYGFHGDTDTSGALNGDYSYGYGSNSMGSASGEVRRFGTHGSTTGQVGHPDAHGSRDRPKFDGYDEEPRGGFAALGKGQVSVQTDSKTSISQSIDDLLGDKLTDALPAQEKDKVISQNVVDDDDFDPRAYSSNRSKSVDTSMDLATQMLNSLEVGGGASSSQVSGLHTSLLVQNLARNGEQSETLQSAPASNLNSLQLVSGGAGEPRPAADDSAYGGLVRFDNILLNKSTRVEPKRPVNRHENGKVSGEQPKVTHDAKAQSSLPSVTKKEMDPFADLVTTAKKSGVL